MSARDDEDRTAQARLELAANGEVTSLDHLDWSAWISVTAPLLGLRIAPSQLEGVSAFLEAARQMAERLGTFPLEDDELALAPVFRLHDPEIVESDRRAEALAAHREAPTPLRIETKPRMEHS